MIVQGLKPRVSDFRSVPKPLTRNHSNPKPRLKPSESILRRKPSETLNPKPYEPSTLNPKPLNP